MIDKEKLVYRDRSYTQQVLSLPYPVNLFKLGEQWLVEWHADGDGSPVNADFLNDLKRSNKSERLFSVIGDDLPEPRLEPALFIFHVSRCGSTLAANYFATDPENRVFNEPMLFANLLEGSVEDQKDVDLNWLINIFSLGRLEEQRRLVIKLSSRHLCHVKWFHETFPDVPKYLIIRDPEEVIVSNVESPPYHLISAGKETNRGLEDLALEYLEEVYEWAVSNSEVFDHIVDYRMLKEQLPLLETKLWKVEGNEERNGHIEHVFKSSSKNLEKEFVEDTSAKKKKWRNFKSAKKSRYQMLVKYYEALLGKIS